jgi:RNA methyltransferase, TrmH family
VITSPHNKRVKTIRALVRRRVREREARFVVEGTRLVEEMVRAGVRPALVFYTQEWLSSPAAQPLAPQLGQAQDGAWLVADAVMAACAETETPQGVLAVVPFVHLPPRPGLVLILDRLRDPGNLGTILRSAEAAGVGQVILTPETVDLHNPKVVRGAMGAHFRLPVARLDWPAIREHLSGWSVWLADARGDVAYDAVDWTAPSALIIGGEAAGAGEEAQSLAGGHVTIPMPGKAESLNAAMAAAVILFEAARQHRTRTP